MEVEDNAVMLLQLVVEVQQVVGDVVKVTFVVEVLLVVVVVVVIGVVV